MALNLDTDPPAWPPRIVIVGDAGTGKSTRAETYARHYRRLDPATPPVVVDFDVIAEALGSPHHHKHPAPHVQAAASAWLGIVRNVRRIDAPLILIHAHPTRPFDHLYYRANGWTVEDTTPQ